MSFYRKEKDSFRVTLNRISTRTWKRDALLCISGLDLMGLFPSTPAESNGLYHNKKKEVLHCLSLPPLYLNIHYKSNSINQKKVKLPAWRKEVPLITSQELILSNCCATAFTSLFPMCFASTESRRASLLHRLLTKNKDSFARGQFRSRPGGNLAQYR